MELPSFEQDVQFLSLMLMQSIKIKINKRTNTEPANYITITVVETTFFSSVLVHE